MFSASASCTGEVGVRQLFSPGLRNTEGESCVQMQSYDDNKISSVEYQAIAYK